MAKARIVTTGAEIDQALRRGKLFQEPRLVRAHYSPGVNVLILVFDNKRRITIPREDIEGLCDASPKVAAEVEITGNGTGARWPTLDLDLYVPQLLKGVYGTRHWMSRIGHMGGLATTPAKRMASRANGCKGGRPLKAAAAASVRSKSASAKNRVRV